LDSGSGCGGFKRVADAVSHACDNDLIRPFGVPDRPGLIQIPLLRNIEIKLDTGS